MILENFMAEKVLRDVQAERRLQHNPDLITEAHIESYRRFWSTFDTNADNRIKKSLLLYVVAQLEYPLGVADANSTDGDVFAPEEHNEHEEAQAEDAAWKAWAQGKGDHDQTWVPKVSEESLEAAGTLIDKLTISTDELGQVTFSDALDALIDRAFADEIRADASALTRLDSLKAAIPEATFRFTSAGTRGGYQQLHDDPISNASERSLVV